MRDKRFVIIGGAIIIIIFAVSLLSNSDKKNELEQYGNLVPGTIIKIYNIRNKGDYVRYEYYAKGVKYTGSDKILRVENYPQLGEVYMVL